MKDIITAFFSGLNSNEKRMLYIACVVACLALFDRLILGPVQGEMGKVEEKIRIETGVIKDNLRILAYRDSIVDRYLKRDKYFEPENLTQEERISKFLSEVEEAAKKSSVALTNINPVNASEQGKDLVYSLVVECTGKMQSLVEFVYALESSQKMLKVVSYTISPKSREEYQVKASLTIVKKVIYPLSKDIFS
ncbi:MAG: hypothetical protein HQL30_07290 [Candidatus Omnitrophica bacterium]|nr:hypothetical protein [Candidatus Omnitrophota bacterium]